MDEELQLLTVHGVLHLLGYDHEEPDEKAEMFGLQAAIVDGWRDRAGADRSLPGPDRCHDHPADHRRGRAGRRRLAGGLRRGRARPYVDVPAAEAVRHGRRGSAKLAQIAADPTRYLNVALLVRVACEMAAGSLVTYVSCASSPGPGRP